MTSVAHISTLGGTMRIVRIIATTFCALALTSLMVVTGTRLCKMAAIRGWVSGATLREHVLTGKRIEQTERGPVHWIRWCEADPGGVLLFKTISTANSGSRFMLATRSQWPTTGANRIHTDRMATTHRQAISLSSLGCSPWRFCVASVLSVRFGKVEVCGL